jgi:hypothetical protein
MTMTGFYMRRFIAVTVTVALLLTGLATSANAGPSSIKSIGWNKKSVNTGSLDPDKSDAKATLRIKVKDTDGVCGVVAGISNPKAKGGPYYSVLALELNSGSSESGTWTAVASDFNSRNSGTWIVSIVYVTDCFGRELKKKNLKSGLGGEKAKLKVTNGDKKVPKVTASAVSDYSDTCETSYDPSCIPIPYEVSVKAKTKNGKPLKGAKVRLTVCYDDTYEDCSFFTLGKTDSKGKLRKQFFPTKFLDSDNSPDWADGGVFSNDEYLAYVTILPTKKTPYTWQSSPTMILYN